ncbi:MAG: monovalent cation/H(+) antiporter subunit G [Sphaerochaetaceae bacterium]|nr:monovalent cation/H(+) antiporter subunit G [Sphaerochaetaceae bacterium]
MEITMIAGGVVSLSGSLFLLLGALGVVRMPDLFNRIQAGTKATTLGTMLFLAGIAIAEPSWIPKLLLLILFIIFTNPVSSHVLARSAHHTGIRMSDKTVVDHLAKTTEQRGSESLQGDEQEIAAAKSKGGER